MSTETILYFAIGVFLLMMVGIALTMWEFYKLNHPEAAEANPRERKVV